ncbi:MAG: hypothetical protein QXJ68_00360 [Methanocellales archaeon]
MDKLAEEKKVLKLTLKKPEATPTPTPTPTTTPTPAAAPTISINNWGSN